MAGSCPARPPAARAVHTGSSCSEEQAQPDTGWGCISSLSAQSAGWGDGSAGREGSENFRYLLAPRGSQEKQKLSHRGAVAWQVTPVQGHRRQPPWAGRDCRVGQRQTRSFSR